MALDTTLVSPLHGDGTVRRTDRMDGVALREAYRDNTGRIPSSVEVTAGQGRSSSEFGGWSQETMGCARGGGTEMSARFSCFQCMRL